MAIARKAVDSTLKRILIYTAEIIASIILLVVICLPLAFTVPMWIQRVALGTPTADLWVNPALWFGPTGALIVTILLAFVSVFFGYPYVMKLIPGVPKEDESVPELADEEDEEEDEEEAEVDEEIAEDEELLDDEEVISESDLDEEEVD